MFARDQVFAKKNNICDIVIAAFLRNGGRGCRFSFALFISPSRAVDGVVVDRFAIITILSCGP